MMTSPPNIILVHSHDLGQYLGCYDVDIATPNIDRLAEEGARFPNHFTAAPQCSPSRGSLFTGLYPHRHGLLGLAHTEWELDVERTLPYRLSERGYETHLFGLQHISETPDDLGYDETHTAGSLSPDVSPEVHSINRARDVAETVESYLNADLQSPFFASVGFFEAHRLEMGEDEEEGDVLYGFGDRYDGDDPDSIEVPSFLPDKPGVREDLAAMRGMVYAIDDAVGTIFDAIESAGLDNETLVIFTTEHGIAFPRAKGTCYDPGIQGCLLLWCPSLIDAGTVPEHLVSNVDILPTILDLVTDEVPDQVDGHSLMPIFDADMMYYPRDELFAEITWHDMYNPMRAVRTDRFKYIRRFWHLPRTFLPNDVYASLAGREVRGRYGRPSRAYEELYDLKLDPYERENVADDEAYAQVRTKLLSKLSTWMHETDDPLLDGPIVPEDYDRMFDGIT
ncbi:sulfatase [Natrinema sp. 1APR25-10V2]|uniref:sulfatase family protein n=1 Tax=Natrinema sp. 1APR25-10V2 TaxID=2951081 RepID=UPI002875943A|nr:sulfatase [Natrinema sp. 1APR25-10V2]MDS0474608.1 sulfatase [Natrinema sp. 1APR25-10V2]